MAVSIMSILLVMETNIPENNSHFLVETGKSIYHWYKLYSYNGNMEANVKMNWIISLITEYRVFHFCHMCKEDAMQE